MAPLALTHNNVRLEAQLLQDPDLDAGVHKQPMQLVQKNCSPPHPFVLLGYGPHQAHQAGLFHGPANFIPKMPVFSTKGDPGHKG